MSKNNKTKPNIPAITKDEIIKKEVLNAFNKRNVTSYKTEEKNAPIDEAKKKWNMNDKILELFADNIKKDQCLKEKYAVILIKMLGIQLIALIIIFILKGRGLLFYSDTTFNIFVAGGIAEVFVLVRVIVEYLFKDNLTNALNIILDRNNQTNYNKKNNKKY